VTPNGTLRVRWLGRVPYREAEALQRALHGRSDDDYLLLLEHPHVYTLGSRARTEHLLFADAADVGAELVVADRGGDVTYHGPGQLVGYPIVSLAEWRAGQRDVVAYVRALEQVLIDALADLGVTAGRSEGYTGVWVDTPRGLEKIAAIGVRVANGRTRHGFALNVDPDLTMFDHIVPCGIADRGVTSLGALLGHDCPTMQQVADTVAAHLVEHFGYADVERSDVVWRERPEDLAPFTRAAARGETPVRLIGRLAEAGVAADATQHSKDRPAWMRVKATMGPEYLELKKLVRGLGLHTVCEEAGCPNIYECWSQQTATFMILGDRCTRACGFCLVDTRKPQPVDRDEPRRVAEAVAVMGLEHVVITCVARDDLPDGGASAFAATVDAIRSAAPPTRVELLISDCRGDAASLETIFAARPDVLNHNLETVARLQRAARPSAGYARSLAVLGRAKDAGLVTKSGLILGMGETEPEVRAAMADLRAVGVDILTLGQYLRPTAHHLPVVRWWTPDEFAALREFGDSLGFGHVEAGPLVRSSYHARDGVDATRRVTA
jgi:lipoic acid synthetase